MSQRIGVLALQGDFAAHATALDRLGVAVQEIRQTADLDDIDGLVLPGGESTTMLKLLDAENLFEPLRRFGSRRPIFGTCAGAILLATEVLHPQQRCLGLMDLTVERNGYGRQIDSRIARIAIDGREAEAVFIRAPIIRRIGPEAQVLAFYDGIPVLVAEGLHLAATFHPELSAQEAGIHRHFLRKVLESKEKNTFSATLEGT